MDEAISLSDRQRAILAAVLGRFADRIDRAAIFGSRVLERSSPSSDIDLVLYGSLDDATVARIWSLFNQSSIDVTVDVIRYETLGESSFKRHIDRYAKTLFDRSELAKAASADRGRDRHHATERVSPPLSLG